jgi:hypothetical protein
MWKFILATLGLIVLLLVLGGIAIHIALFTDLPRTMTEQSLQEKLGTEVSIRELKTEWEGRSQLRDVSIRLPIRQKCFLNIESARVKHNNPVELVLGKDLRVYSLHAEGTQFRFYQQNESQDQKVITVGDATVELTVKHSSPASRLSTVLLQDPNLGHIETVISAKESLIELKSIEGQLFGGDFTGGAAVEPNRWEKTKINFSWNNLDLRRIKKWWPKAGELLGPWSGEIEIKPAGSRRPLEPLAVEGQMNMEGKIFEDLNSERLEFSGAMGRRRLLLTGFQTPVLNGRLRGNARLSKKEHEYFLYTNWNFDNIDVNEVADLFPEKNKMVGRVNGKGHFMTSLKMNDMSGYLNLTLTESNLANNKIIGTLYNTLNLKQDASKPLGRGRVELRFNGAKLEISDFYYYNRGAEIRGTGVIRNLRQGMDSPVEGVVMATTRPLKDIDLPGVNILDKFLYLAQREMASVRIDGTLEGIQVNVVALPEIQSVLQRLLGGTK